MAHLIVLPFFKISKLKHFHDQFYALLGVMTQIRPKLKVDIKLETMNHYWPNLSLNCTKTKQSKMDFTVELLWPGKFFKKQI